MRFLCIISVLWLSACSSDPYIRPKVVLEKVLSESSKPSAKASVEVGTVLKPNGK